MSPRELTLGSAANASKLTLTDDEILVVRPGNKKWPTVRAPLTNVLWAELDKDRFEAFLLAKREPNSPLSLVHVTGPVPDADKALADSFAQSLMAAAYPALAPRRRLMVIINPRSGPGKGAAQYRRSIEPIFRAARCHVDAIFTVRSKQAQEIAETLPLDKFDAVVVLSGDGLIHEVFNGFAGHAEPMKAFRIPVAPVPTGSGNGMAINILGRENLKDLAVAALNAIKGRPMNVDLLSITQGGNRTFSFMSQCLGLMADLDLGTEHMRFLGSLRFVIGFFWEVIRHRQHPYKISIKVAEANKHKMIENMHALRANAQGTHGASSSPYSTTDTPTDLPDLKHTGPEVDKDGWITLDKSFTYIYAGKGPYVSVDLMQFPVSHPDDGLIDIVLSERVSRTRMLKAIGGAEHGSHFWREGQRYFKAYAYRVEPRLPSGYLSVDGEAYPHEPFEVEAHQGLGAFLSMHGHYNTVFDLPQPESK